MHTSRCRTQVSQKPGPAEIAARDYAAKLFTITEAAKIFGLTNKTFFRLRKLHGITVLTGGKIHIDDVISALNRERNLLK